MVKSTKPARLFYGCRFLNRCRIFCRLATTALSGAAVYLLLVGKRMQPIVGCQTPLAITHLFPPNLNTLENAAKKKQIDISLGNLKRFI